MEQIYFLSIVCNCVAGFVLVAEHLSEKIASLKIFESFFKNLGVRVILAFAVILVSLIKLVWPFNGIPFLGDLLPMLIGLVLGFTLIYDFLRSRSDTHTPSMETLDKIFINNKYLVGIASFLISFIHFWFPGAIIF